MDSGLTFTLLTAPTGDMNQFVISSAQTDATGVIVRYRSLPGNLPNTYKNSISLWNTTIPNLSTEPLKTAPITTDNETGEVHVEYGLVPTDYSVTYQTGGKESMCAMAQIRLAKMLAIGPPMSVTLAIQSISTTSIQIHYSTLPGYLPGLYENWIGIWQGFALPYPPAPDPDVIFEIISNASESTATINYAFGPYTYTLIYFTGKDRINAAAFLYFNVETT